MEGVAHQGRPLPSPPPDFAVYGLAEPWASAGWLDSYGDNAGDPVRWVRVAHENAGAGAVVLVETHSRAMTDAQASRTGEPSLQTVAFGAAVVLVNLTLPAASVPRPPGLRRALADLAAARGDRYAQWSPVSWRVDGVPVTARAWRFAGGWAAYCDGAGSPPGAYLGAAGTGIDPDGLAFAALPDGVAWNFDLARAWRQRRREHERWHDDQLRLIGEQENDSPAS